jgi:hypothetical protein
MAKVVYASWEAFCIACMNARLKRIGERRK